MSTTPAIIDRRTTGLLALDLAGAGLLVATGAIHLDLYFRGYGPVPTIGPLFLLQSASAFALAVLLVVGRLLAPARQGLAAAAGALFALSTLGGYLLTLVFGLFGFKEVPTSAGAWAGAVEIAAFCLLGTEAARTVPGRWRPVAFRLLAPGAGAATAALVLALVLVQPGSAAGVPAAGRSLVATVKVAGFGQVLATPQGASLYLLSDETDGHIACTSGCLSIWPPLMAGPKARALRSAPGLAGTLGLARRGRSFQATYNGYPLYTYAGDPGPAASAGEGVVSNGGTWYLVRASARTPGQTPVTRAARP